MISRCSDSNARSALSLLCFAWLFCGPLNEAVAAEDGPKFAPSTAYESRPLEGWTIRVLSRFPVDEPRLFEETWTLLRYQLLQIVRVVPPAAVEKIRTILSGWKSTSRIIRAPATTRTPAGFARTT